MQHGVRTIAFPAISTGIYRFPHDRAAEIALRETVGFLAHDATIEQVIFVCFDAENLSAYSDAVQRLRL